jgi:hypothetical protein
MGISRAVTPAGNHHRLLSELAIADRRNLRYATDAVRAAATKLNGRRMRPATRPLNRAD